MYSNYMEVLAYNLLVSTQLSMKLVFQQTLLSNSVRKNNIDKYY